MVTFILQRLNERSTWLIVSGAITSASQLPYPWSVAALIVGIVGGLIPDGPVKKA